MLQLLDPELEVSNNGLIPAALRPTLEDPFTPKATPLDYPQKFLFCDEIDGEELEITTPIQKRRIQSTSLSPVQASTITNEVIRPPQPPQPPIRSPTRPSTLASPSTNIQPPVASTSRDPMSPEPESIFDNHCRWNISGIFTDQMKVNKKVVTSLFSEVDALTEVFVDKPMKGAIPGEPTIALAQEAVAYENALVVKFRESLKKFDEDYL
ncbi:hypothetical protein O181_116330 [Austropuccinia psidii MF-1]|uniref:Uncharacterized protein n=1 Tax=Austropuccinia psidii MF-1 TaxID=1389203 RepID=A0A9Q3K869_9BASI|nr:hypothetical protein [Austropuccinia psidii MF-1]